VVPRPYRRSMYQFTVGSQIKGTEPVLCSSWICKLPEQQKHIPKKRYINYYSDSYKIMMGQKWPEVKRSVATSLAVWSSDGSKFN
jgi:hypothetical protein